MSATPKTDYVSGGLDLLRQAYKERPLIAGLFTAYLNHAQVLENALNTLQAGLSIPDAIGVTLDNIGSIVGADRNGLDDATYRLFLLAAIYANHGDATLTSVVSLAQQLFETQFVFCKTPLTARRTGGPTGAFVSLSIGSPQLPKDLWPIAERLLRNNIGGGIHLDAVSTFNADGAFAFAGEQKSQPWVGRGFGSVTDSTAGAPFASFIDGNSP